MGETYGRHIYVGTAPYKPAVLAELPVQIDTTRAYGAHGQLHFRYAHISSGSPFGDRYARPALVPPMDWLDMSPPATPAGLAFVWDDDMVTLRWPRATGGDAEARRYAVYRIRSAEEPDVEAALADARNLLAVTGDTLMVDRPAIADEPYYYVVTAVSANSIESTPTDAVVLEGRAVSTEEAAPLASGLGQNYPNPFAGSTTFAFSLDRPAASVGLRIYDLLGREVAAPLNGVALDAGPHTVEWTPERLGSGTYVYVLDVDGRREVRRLTLIR
jgi:hypothetical protein